jgi:hypothetical protein
MCERLPVSRVVVQYVTWQPESALASDEGLRMFVRLPNSSIICWQLSDNQTKVSAPLHCETRAWNKIIFSDVTVAGFVSVSFIGRLVIRNSFGNTNCKQLHKWLNYNYSFGLCPSFPFYNPVRLQKQLDFLIGSTKTFCILQEFLLRIVPEGDFIPLWNRVWFQIVVFLRKTLWRAKCKFCVRTLYIAFSKTPERV